jgi:hypothetical protein
METTSQQRRLAQVIKTPATVEARFAKVEILRQARRGNSNTFSAILASKGTMNRRSTAQIGTDVTTSMPTPASACAGEGKIVKISSNEEVSILPVSVFRFKLQAKIERISLH